MKKLFAILMLTMFVAPAAMAAEDKGCYDTFYQTKNMQCVAGLIKTLQRLGDNPSDPEGSHANIQALVGFLAEMFNTYPQEKERILKEESAPYTKGIYLEALVRAGLQQEAQSYAEANRLSDLLKHYEQRNLAAVRILKPQYVPSDNDLLLGAYAASGNAGYIQTILQNFSDADDAMVRDAFRIALVTGKFGPTLTPKGRKSHMPQALCEKYECKKDPRKLMRVMTLATAFWSTGSMGKKHEGMQKARTDFFEGNPHLKQLLLLEQNDFANYITLFVAQAAIKNNPDIESGLTSYEQLKELDVKKALKMTAPATKAAD